MKIKSIFIVKGSAIRREHKAEIGLEQGLSDKGLGHTGP